MKKIIIVFAILLCGISAMKAQEKILSKDSVEVIKKQIIERCKQEVANSEFVFEGMILARYFYWDKISHKLCSSQKIKIHKIIKGEDKLKHGTVEFYEYEENRGKDSTLSQYRKEELRCRYVFFCSEVKGKFRKSPTIDTMQTSNTIRLRADYSNGFKGTGSFQTRWDSIGWMYVCDPYWTTPTKEFYKLMGLQPASRKEERYVKRMDRQALRRIEREVDVDTTGAYLRKKRADSIAVEMKNFQQTYSAQNKQNTNNVILRYKIRRWSFLNSNQVELSSSSPTYLERAVILLQYDKVFYKKSVYKNKFKIDLMNELLDSTNYKYSLIPSDYDENTIMLTLIYNKGKRIRLDSINKPLFDIHLFSKDIYAEGKGTTKLVNQDVMLKNSFYTLSDTSAKYEKNQSLQGVFQYSNIQSVGLQKRGGITETNETEITSFEYYVNGVKNNNNYVRAGCEDYILNTTKNL